MKKKTNLKKKTGFSQNKVWWTIKIPKAASFSEKSNFLAIFCF